MSGDKSSLFAYGAAAEALRREEFARLKASSMPAIEALQAMAVEELADVVTGMLERLGYTHLTTSESGTLIMGKEGRKLIVMCGVSSASIRSMEIARLHDIIGQANAEAGFFVTAREFSPEAQAYATGLPITLVDGVKLLASLRQSMKDVKTPDNYRVMCKVCGTIMRHSLSKAQAIACKCGHSVAPTIARAAIMPVPAKSGGASSSPRTRPHSRAEMRAHNKRLAARKLRAKPEDM